MGVRRAERRKCQLIEHRSSWRIQASQKARTRRIKNKRLQGLEDELTLVGNESIALPGRQTVCCVSRGAKPFVITRYRESLFRFLLSLSRSVFFASKPQPLRGRSIDVALPELVWLWHLFCFQSSRFVSLALSLSLSLSLSLYFSRSLDRRLAVRRSISHYRGRRGVR
jgi:hypothetical protein